MIEAFVHAYPIALNQRATPPEAVGQRRISMSGLLRRLPPRTLSSFQDERRGDSAIVQVMRPR
jgi:hypothetical protein